MQLPPYASTDEARAILARIVEREPATGYSSSDDYAAHGAQYRGADAKALRKLFMAAWANLTSEGNAAHKAGDDDWEASVQRRMRSMPRPDEVIDAVLRDPSLIGQGFPVTDLGDGKHRAAA